MSSPSKGLRAKAARKAKALPKVRKAPKAAKAVFHPVPDELMTKVLADVTGGMSLRKATEAHGVEKMRFHRTVDASETWANHYMRARASCMDAIAEELLEIQDEEPPLRDPGGLAPGAPKADPAWVAWQKNRIDTRKWLLSKLAPKKYGDKVATEISGPDGGPVETKVEHACADSMAVLAAKIAKLKAGG